MQTQSVRCRVCGHETDSELLRDRYGGACPNCLKVFVAEGLLASSTSSLTPAPSGGEFGKFILTDRLGKGGMGEVWKAFDKELNRWVALKFLREENPRELARFQREARTAAGLAHPGIAAIYEVGETDGRHFIAMQYVEGRTLHTFPRGDRKLLVRLIRDAARALDHAHQHGVIHRDLKPENLMVEKSGDASRLVILDFGLARAIEGGERLSKSGTVVGTIGYMSPEQAKGGKLDERADLYSLGATLYDILTGKPPFEGSNCYDLLKKVEDEDPVPPRRINARIAPDLETIVLKCLEKARDRRYGSAKELADDLDRFLEGDAIMARRPSTIYRLRMKLAKRKSVVAIATAAVVLAVAFGWKLLVGSSGAEYATRYAAATILWAEARGLAMIGVDPEGIRTRSRTAREAFERAIEAQDEGQAHLMRGRCLELEGQDEEALRALERAHALDPGLPEARVELAKALFLKYRASRGTPSIATTSRGSGAVVQHRIGELSPETAEQVAWRERGERLLEEGKAAPAQESLLKGLRAMGKGNYAKAAEALAVYTKAERWDAQVLRLEGICFFYALDFRSSISTLDQSLSRVPTARSLHWRALAKLAIGLYDEAIRDYTQAIELNPRDARTYTLRGKAKNRKGLHDEAIADHTKAIELDPKFARAYSNRGNAKADKGLLDEAIADDTKAIELDPDLAIAYLNRAEARADKGLFDEAIADCSKVIEFDPKNAPAYARRGRANKAKGLLDDAIADLATAIELDPHDAGAFLWRGRAKSEKGLVDEAIVDYTKAIELDSRYASAYAWRGRAKEAKGLLDDAIADLTKAIELNPKSEWAFRSRGDALLDKGRIDEAIVDYTKAIELDPKYADAYGNRGLAKCRKGLLDEGLADYTKAIELDPKNANAYANRGLVMLDMRLFDEAIADFEKALKVAPAGWPDRAWTQERVGNAKADRLFQEPWTLFESKRFREAIEKFKNVVELHPRTEAGIGSAYNIACGYALLGERKNALDWLEKSVEMGWQDVDHIEKDADLDSLRKEDRYQKLVARLKAK